MLNAMATKTRSSPWSECPLSMTKPTFDLPQPKHSISCRSISARRRLIKQFLHCWKHCVNQVKALVLPYKPFGKSWRSASFPSI